jgi:hypothetical protein
MTALTQLATGFEKSKVIGQAGMLDTARFTHFVAERLQVPVASVKTLTLGSHGDTMVPVPSHCTVDGKPLAELLPADEVEQLVVRTRNGGAEVVALLKTGSAYYAPSAAAARMVKAVAEDSGAVMPVCAWVDGEYGISGVYLGVEAELGAEGVRRVVETPLTASETASLREPPRRSAPSRRMWLRCRDLPLRVLEVVRLDHAQGDLLHLRLSEYGGRALLRRLNKQATHQRGDGDMFCLRPHLQYVGGPHWNTHREHHLVVLEGLETRGFGLFFRVLGENGPTSLLFREVGHYRAPVCS